MNGHQANWIPARLMSNALHITSRLYALRVRCSLANQIRINSFLQVWMLLVLRTQLKLESQQEVNPRPPPHQVICGANKNTFKYCKLWLFSSLLHQKTRLSTHGSGIPLFWQSLLLDMAKTQNNIGQIGIISYRLYAYHQNNPCFPRLCLQTHRDGNINKCPVPVINR